MELGVLPKYITKAKHKCFWGFSENFFEAMSTPGAVESGVLHHADKWNSSSAALLLSTPAYSILETHLLSSGGLRGASPLQFGFF